MSCRFCNARCTHLASSRAKRPDSFFCAVFWRVGPRSRGISLQCLQRRAFRSALLNFPSHAANRSIPANPLGPLFRKHPRQILLFQRPYAVPQLRRLLKLELLCRFPHLRFELSHRFGELRL